MPRALATGVRRDGRTLTAPTAGEPVLHCGHPQAPLYHVGSVPPIEGIVSGWPRYMVACAACFRRAGRDFGSVPVRGEACWPVGGMFPPGEAERNGR